MTSPAPLTLASGNPQLAWTTIAQHARTHHRARWNTDADAITAIIGAFDAILPTDFGYHPGSGTIGSNSDTPDAAPPRWTDPQQLICIIAALAANLPDCDLATT